MIAREGDAPGPGRADEATRLGTSLLACALAALWVAFGAIHRHHSGDSLIPILVSLQRWTPFYWEQDRYGMLVPLLALPIRHPLANLLAQTWLTAMAGLSVFFLLARFIRVDATCPLMGALGAGSFLAMAPMGYQSAFLGTEQPYNVSMALGLGGLVLAEPPSTAGGDPRVRRAMAFGLLGLAHWVNFAAILALGPLVVARFVCSGEASRIRLGWPARSRVGPWLRGLAGSRTGSALILLGGGYEVGLLVMGQATYPHTGFASRPPADWPEGWSRLAGNTWAALAPGAWPLLLVAAAALGATASLVRGRGGPAFRAAGALACSAVVGWLYLGTKQWTAINHFAHRYVLPSALLLQGALTAVAVAPLSGWWGPRARGWFGLGIVPALLLTAAIGHEFPSLSRVRGDLDRTLGAGTPDILANRCTHVAGEYFRVWPAVFHANWKLAERGEHRAIYGVTFRSSPTRADSRRVPRGRIRVAIARGDTLGEIWLGSSLFPRMELEGESATIRVLRPVPPVPGRRDWPTP